MAWHPKELKHMELSQTWLCFSRCTQLKKFMHFLHWYWLQEIIYDDDRMASNGMMSPTKFHENQSTDSRAKMKGRDSYTNSDTNKKHSNGYEY
jgi:hypothetical protein